MYLSPLATKEYADAIKSMLIETGSGYSGIMRLADNGTAHGTPTIVSPGTGYNVSDRVYFEVINRDTQATMTSYFLIDSVGGSGEVTGISADVLADMYFNDDNTFTMLNNIGTGTGLIINIPEVSRSPLPQIETVDKGKYYWLGAASIVYDDEFEVTAPGSLNITQQTYKDGMIVSIDSVGGKFTQDTAVTVIPNLITSKADFTNALIQYDAHKEAQRLLEVYPNRVDFHDIETIERLKIYSDVERKESYLQDPIPQNPYVLG